MNKFKYYFVLLLAGLAIVSCHKGDDNPETVPLRDYEVQYKADNDSIEKFLKTNYILEVTPDLDIKFAKIPTGGTQTSIMDQQQYPIEHRDVYNHGVNYKVYYLTLRKGTGASPCNTDRISTAYTGSLLNGTVFDTSYGLARSFELYVYGTSPVIDGWGEIFPQFKTGTSTTGADGVIKYDNYGAGVMFLPSGLGYYGNSQSSIPVYSPLIFSFKLFDLQRLDHDLELVNGQSANIADGVPDYLEDLNHDGYLYNSKDTVRYPVFPSAWVEDTDGDGLADYLDSDDDGDGYTTRYEITKATGEVGIVNGFNYGASKYFPWDPTVDNPLTPNVDETEPRGIPRRPTGALTDPSQPESISNPRKFVEEDYNAAGRLRIHVDKTYPYQKK